jgi:glycosyltransferase involved in cell wall biosynthesis
MTRLKIALVANNIHYRGGMERYCAELTNALCERHDMHLFASEIDDVPLDKVNIHRIATVKRPIFLLFLQYYWKSSRAVKIADFDIVHTIGGITARQNFVTAQYCQLAWGETIRTEPGASEGINLYHQFMWRMAGFFERRAVTSPSTLRISANSKRTRSDLVRFYGCNP